MSTDDDSSLVADLKAGCPEAFEKLVLAFSPRLLASATRVLRSHEEAQDAVQDGLISTWKNIAQFNEDSALYTWLHRIIINACLARLRSSHSKRMLSMEDAGGSGNSEFAGLAAAWPPSGPSLEERVAMRRTLERALEELPEELRLVLILRDVEEFSSKEVAGVLGVTDANVRQRLHRARTIMAELLRPELCSGSDLTCGGQLDLLFDYIDNLLLPAPQQLVRDHISTCPTCSELEQGYRATIGLPRSILELTHEDSLPSAFLTSTVA